MLNKNTYLLNNARSWLATAAAATAAAAADACCIDTLRPFSDSITCSIKEFFSASFDCSITLRSL